MLTICTNKCYYLSIFGWKLFILLILAGYGWIRGITDIYTHFYTFKKEGKQ